MLYNKLLILIICFSLTTQITKAQSKQTHSVMTEQQAALVRISSQAAVGDLEKLTEELHKGLDKGLTINSIKESLIHLYAYTGFPRSIRALQTLMTVIEEREQRGVIDHTGKDASPISSSKDKYDRGKAILQQLTGTQENDVKTGYASFAPTIEIFLKEHLFADLFERDVLTYLERELVTISVLASIGRVRPMLKSHMSICINLGCSPRYLEQFVNLIKEVQGDDKAAEAVNVLADILNK